MKHPSDESIITYLYGEAAADEIRLMETHLAACPDCADKVAGLKKTAASVDKIAETPVPEFLGERLSASFEKKQPAAENHEALSEIMTPQELGEFLKVPIGTIYELLSDIPYLTLAGQIRFRRSSVERWLELREKNPVSSKTGARDIDASFKLWRNIV